MNEVTIGKTGRFSWGKRNTEIIKILRFDATSDTFESGFNEIMYKNQLN